ncbi:hypothetical protein EYC84_009800 [Monilinia fructicola]|uniref:Uncharacterized protein n=1 Tax=Monilinia fructicola TaxID=38448 RepID=A0A5M9JDL7_MONFR|nr:hypothetical protein EYC84_009800 [Monilinia fructicola]
MKGPSTIQPNQSTTINPITPSTQSLEFPGSISSPLQYSINPSSVPHLIPNIIDVAGLPIDVCVDDGPDDDADVMHLVGRFGIRKLRGRYSVCMEGLEKKAAVHGLVGMHVYVHVHVECALGNYCMDCCGRFMSDDDDGDDDDSGNDIDIDIDNLTASVRVVLHATHDEVGI